MFREMPRWMPKIVLTLVPRREIQMKPWVRIFSGFYCHWLAVLASAKNLRSLRHSRSILLNREIHICLVISLRCTTLIFAVVIHHSIGDNLISDFFAPFINKSLACLATNSNANHDPRRAEQKQTCWASPSDRDLEYLFSFNISATRRTDVGLWILDFWAKISKARKPLSFSCQLTIASCRNSNSNENRNRKPIWRTT